MFIKSWDGQRAVNLNRVVQIFYRPGNDYSAEEYKNKYMLIADSIIIGFVNSEEEAKQWVDNILTVYNNRRI